MGLSVEHGVLYDWPTHVRMPDGYPPWGADPIQWREANEPGWSLPEPSDFGINLASGLRDGLWTLAALVGLAPSQFVEWLQEIGGDYTKVFAMLNNGTRTFRVRRQEAFSGDEMSVAFVCLLEGIGGSGKSRMAMELIWWDHLARHSSGYYRRHGFTPSDKFWRLGPWNFCADTIDYDENSRTKYPDYVPTCLDDPVILVDALDAKIRAGSVANITNLGTKERSRGRTFTFTNVYNAEYDPRLFSETMWSWAYARVKDFFAYTIRRTRRSSENYKWTEFLVPMHPHLDIGGPLAAAPGAELDRLFQEIKFKAHEKLYSGNAVSRPAARVDLLLAEDPEGFMENCVTTNRLRDWLEDELASRYSMGDAAIEQTFNVLWRAFGRSGYKPLNKKETGGRWAVKDNDDVVVFVLGQTPDRRAAFRLARQVREKLPLDKSRLGDEKMARRTEARIPAAARRVA